MGDLSAIGHHWEVEQDTCQMPDDSGLFMLELPTGYGSFACSCGVSEHGLIDRMAELAKEHDSSGAS